MLYEVCIFVPLSDYVVHVFMILQMAAGLTVAPLVVKVDPNLNVILTACLTVYVGCYRSVKATPPSVSTIGNPSCTLSSFSFLSICLTLLKCDILILCRRQCLMNMPCASLWLGVLCCYHYSYSLSLYQKTWLMLFWRATSLYLGSSLFRMFFPYGPFYYLLFVASFLPCVCLLC